MSDYYDFYFKKAGNIILPFQSCYQRKSSVFSCFCHLPYLSTCCCSYLHMEPKRVWLGVCNWGYGYVKCNRI